MVQSCTSLKGVVADASNFLYTDIVIRSIVLIGILAYLFDLLMQHTEGALML